MEQMNNVAVITFTNWFERRIDAGYPELFQSDPEIEIDWKRNEFPLVEFLQVFCREKPAI